MLPGISEATLIVTVFVPVAAAVEIAIAHMARTLVTVTAAIVALRVDFISYPFLSVEFARRGSD